MSEETQKTYHAVEKNGVVTAIWEMIGRKHIRTIDPRSKEGQAMLTNYTPANAAAETNSNAKEAGKSTGA